MAGAGVGSPSAENRYILEDHPDIIGPRDPNPHVSSHEPGGADPIDRLPGNVLVEGPLDLAEAPTPANPTANRHKIYPKADGKLYKLDSAGVEKEIGLDVEAIQDLVGAMLDGTLSGITLTYDDDNGKINAAVTYGSSADTACEGNDARLEDERNPTIHDSSKHSDTYVLANADITGATKTKVTYDAKGLVTAGEFATTADIAETTDKNYVTDAEKTLLGNTSGTNTGDQTTITGNAGTATTLETARMIAGTSFDGSANIDIAHGGLQDHGTKTHAQLDSAADNSETHIAAAAPHSGHVQIGGQLGGTVTSPTVTGVTESGSQALTIGAISDGQRVKRNGTSLEGVTDHYYFPITIDGSENAITTGAKGDALIPVSGTIVGWTLTAKETGSIVLDLWKDTYANYPPTVADTITATAKPTLSSAKKATDSTLTGWTTTVTEGEFLGVNVDSCSTITRATLWLKIQLS